jgi:hypothetical protein
MCEDKDFVKSFRREIKDGSGHEMPEGGISELGCVFGAPAYYN